MKNPWTLNPLETKLGFLKVILSLMSLCEFSLMWLKPFFFFFKTKALILEVLEVVLCYTFTTTLDPKTHTAWFRE